MEHFQEDQTVPTQFFSFTDKINTEIDTVFSENTQIENEFMKKKRNIETHDSEKQLSKKQLLDILMNLYLKNSSKKQNKYCYELSSNFRYTHFM